MNHIQRLTTDRAEANEKLTNIQEAITDLMSYLTSPKFQGPGNDMVHISTDLMPKLRELRMMAL